MADAINNECHLLSDRGFHAFLVDCAPVPSADPDAIPTLTVLYEAARNELQSVVFLFDPPQASLAALLDPDRSLPFAFTREEALDIIHMELLERTLMGEDEPPSEA